MKGSSHGGDQRRRRDGRIQLIQAEESVQEAWGVARMLVEQQTGPSLSRFQMFSSTRSRFPTSLHWRSSQGGSSSVCFDSVTPRRGASSALLRTTTVIEGNLCRVCQRSSLLRIQMYQKQLKGLIYFNYKRKRFTRKEDIHMPLCDKGGLRGSPS